MSRPLDPRLLREAPALRRLLPRLAVLQLLVAVVGVVQAVTLAVVLTAVVQDHRSGGTLVAPLLVLGAAAGGRALLAAVQELLAQRASAACRHELRSRALAAVARRGPSWASAQPPGRLATATGPGLEALDGYVTRAVPALVAAVVGPAVTLAALLWADWRSAALLLVLLPLVPLFMALVGVSTGRRMEQRYAALSRLAGHFLDLVTGLTTLKVYGQGHRQLATVRRATDHYRKVTLQTLRLAFLSGLVLDLLATLSVAVVAVAVGLRLDHGHLGLRSALVTLLLAPELFAPLRAMGAQHHATEEGRVAAEAVLAVLDEPADSPQESLDVLPSNGSVVLRGVCLTYDGRDARALDDLSLDVPAGQLVAIQGTSGGGKSTLVAVLLGLRRPDGGEVEVGGVPLDPTSGDAWRARLAWVPQRPRPTQRDVRAEVSLGDPRASASAVLQAIRDCRAPVPATALGEDGTAVSAGQRRRIALARALLRARSVRDSGRTPVVLLDEPSEDLDRETEIVVAHVVRSMAGWATVLMVTHSQVLAAVADRRVVIEQGRVVADAAQAAAPVRLPDPDQRVRPVAPTTVAPQAVPAARARLAALTGLPHLGRRVGAAVLLSGATGLAGVALTATSVWLLCRASQHPNLQALALAVVGVRTFALAKALLRYAERLVGHDVALRLLADLRTRVFAALLPLAPAGLADLRRGDLLRRFVGDVDGVQEGLVRAVVPLGGALVTGAGSVALAAVISPPAALVLATGLTLGALASPLATLLAGNGRPQVELGADRDQRVTALLDGLPELTAYGAVPQALADLDEVDGWACAAARRPALASAVGTAVAGLAPALCLPLVLATAAGHAPVLLTAVLAAVVLGAFDAQGGLAAAFGALRRLQRGLERVTTLLAAQPPVPEPDMPVPAPVGAISLLLDDVSVAPGRGALAVVVDTTLQVSAGARVAVTGPSGCGKTTLLRAALRLLPVRGGAAGLSGDTGLVALQDLTSAQLPPLAAGSLQGDHVFDATLRDNLLVVRPDATEHDLDEVAQRAGLADLVHGLPLGWATPAGADGAALSGGQRQRLLLARALLADPAVLVLDEPTAHLDDVTAAAVLADLLDATRGSTLLLTSHRALPSTGLDAVVALTAGAATVAS